MQQNTCQGGAGRAVGIYRAIRYSSSNKKDRTLKLPR